MLLALAFITASCIAKDPEASLKSQESCVLIITDDDIPSGSATAGALYVEEARLGKKLLTSDVVATVEGFLQSGAKCIHVLDGHNEAIDKSPLLAMGVPVITPANAPNWQWPFLGPMVAKYIKAALIGFHTPAGIKGFRAHTVDGSVKLLKINGDIMGEVAHLIIGLGAFNIPVVLISGDMNATKEASKLLPNITPITVRWADKDGKTRFLSSSNAGKKLKAAAYKSKNHSVKPYKFKNNINVELTPASWRSLKEKTFGIDKEFNTWVGDKKELIENFQFKNSLKVFQKNLSWESPNLLSTYLSIFFAIKYIKGPDTWDLVTKGYKAYKEGNYDSSIKYYLEALKKNPNDLSSKCRLAAAYRGQNKLKEARKLLIPTVANIDEIGIDAIKSWCWLELAIAEKGLGNIGAARKAAEKILALPDFKNRHQKAKNLTSSMNH